MAVWTLLATLFAGVAPAVATTSRADSPGSWDPRIEPIAKKVEQLRKLQFEHPVKVRFLSPEKFNALQRTEHADLSKAEQEDLKRSQSQLRALGLIGRDVDLLDASNDIGSSDVLAFYDPKTKRVTVKGTGPLDEATKVTVAHELTHALQDQHFDLQRLTKVGREQHTSAAVRAIVEGDAVRIQNDYQSQLSDADQRAAEQQSEQASNDARADAQSKQVPSMLLALFEAPYAFGPIAVNVAQSSVRGGINHLFESPPPSEASILTPSNLVDSVQPVDVPAPKLASGEKKIGTSDSFGALALYLVLASQLGPADALHAADLWSGDSMITLDRNGQTCVRSTFVGKGVEGTKTIADALRRWAASMPTGTATVADVKPGVQLTACDTGAAVPAPTHDGDEVTTFAASRDALYETLLGQSVPSKTAMCAADGVVRDPVFTPLLAHPNDTPDPAALTALRARVTAITKDCVTT